MGIRSQTKKNLLIVLGLNIFDKAAIFIGLVVLARLLKPADFGILAVSEILVAFLSIFNEHIFETSAIAISGDDDFEITLSMAFVTRLAISFALYGMLYFLSGPWASFYHNPDLAPSIRVLGLNIFLYNLFFVPHTALLKEQRFDKLAIPGVCKNILLYGIAVVLAVRGFKFWSLILSRVITEAMMAPLYFMIKRWRILFIWRKEIFYRMLRYTKYLYLYMLLVFFITQIDRAIIGKILGMSFVGYYATAYSFGHWTVNNIFAVCDRVAFPLYSALKNDTDRLKAAYLKFFEYIIFLSVPVITCLILFAEHFVLLFLGAQWIAIITPLKILCVAGFFGLIGNISNSLLKSIERVDIEVRRNLIFAIILLVLIIPLTVRYGLNGACLAVLFSSCAVQPAYFIYTIQTVGVEKNKIALPLIMAGGASVCGILFYIFCNKLFLINIKWAFGHFMLSIASYGSAYAAMVFLLMRREHKRIG